MKKTPLVLAVSMMLGLLAGTGAIVSTQPTTAEREMTAHRADTRLADRLYGRWDAALATGDPSKVNALYAPNADLLPTLAAGIHDTPAERADYFKEFLAKKPDGTVTAHDVKRIAADVLVDSGEYSFAFGDGSTAAARFTFVYERLAGTWKIVAHHSSLEPASSTQDED